MMKAMKATTGSTGTGGVLATVSPNVTFACNAMKATQMAQMTLMHPIVVAA